MATATNSRREIRAHPGPQTQFLSSPADIAIYGGAAGGGKTYGILLEPLRHIHRPQFGALIFRRTFRQVTQQGGLWSKAEEVFPHARGEANLTSLAWRFPSNAEIQFAHLQHESDKYSYQGAEIALLEFDELTHFTETQFFYLLTRNRSTCGIRPYCRATTNPDADSWVAKLISWWIDQDTGYPIPARSGKLRYMMRDGDTIIWGSTRAEVYQQAPHLFDQLMDGGMKLTDLIQSVTFIPAALADNPTLTKADPGYRAKLMMQPLVERERLLGGNWKIRPTAGLYFRDEWFPRRDRLPPDSEIVCVCRAWDRAATEVKPGEDPDWTAGPLMVRTIDGDTGVISMERLRGSPGQVQDTIRDVCAADRRRWGDRYTVCIITDPGQAGKTDAWHLGNLLHGYRIVFHSERGGDKVRRAGPLSSRVEHRHVWILRGEQWERPLVDESVAFPDGLHDDQVDAMVAGEWTLDQETMTGTVTTPAEWSAY